MAFEKEGKPLPDNAPLRPAVVKRLGSRVNAVRYGEF